MTFDISKSVDIIETMENYMAKVRPGPEIRQKLDIGYEIKGQSVILHEIRSVWNKPSEIQIRFCQSDIRSKQKNLENILATI